MPSWRAKAEGRQGDDFLDKPPQGCVWFGSMRRVESFGCPNRLAASENAQQHTPELLNGQWLKKSQSECMALSEDEGLGEIAILHFCFWTRSESDFFLLGFLGWLEGSELSFGYT